MCMRIPSKKECYRLICEMRMMDHIVAHSIRVCQVATILVDSLAQQEKSLNRDLIQASALLHDITKTNSFKTGENHAHTAEKLLEGLGYPEAGRIIGQHVMLYEYSASKTPVEAEIVNYADKRVLHEKVVSLKERMDYITGKYAKGPEDLKRITEVRGKTERLEAKFCRLLPFLPEGLNCLVKSEDYDIALAEYHLVQEDFLAGK